MKTNKQPPPDKSSNKPETASEGGAAAPTRSGVTWWAYAIGLFLSLFAVLEVYQPTLAAPFLFDDLYLPFLDPTFSVANFRNWVAGVRPLLMFTYWLNYQASELNPAAYHVWNVILHLGASAFAWLIVRDLLGRAGEQGWKREILAAFAGGVFLLHPLQTESVSYVASRSEALSVMFAYAAILAYLRRRPEGITWPHAGLVLLLSAAAVLSKEHTAALAAVFVLIDLYWSEPPALKALLHNWKLYLPLSIGGAFGLAFVAKVLRASTSAGFGMKDLSWTDYFLTQCRAIWVYVRLIFAPYGQNIDYDFPLSRSPFEHGAIFGLLALLALVAAALYYRRRFPLASFGVLVFLLLLAPTSSIVPIMDTLVERRVYLPFLGMLLVVVAALRNWRTTKLVLVSTLSAILLILGALTYSRNLVWSSPVALWSDAASKSPAKARPHFQYAYALYAAGRCGPAAQEYAKVAKLQRTDSALLVDWALAYECSGELASALDKLQLALAQEPTAHVYSLVGMIRAKQGLTREAWAALDEAVRTDARYEMTYVYRGNLSAAAGDLEAAAAEYRKALRINPNMRAAQDALANLELQLRATPEQRP